MNPSAHRASSTEALNRPGLTRNRGETGMSMRGKIMHSSISIFQVFATFWLSVSAATASVKAADKPLSHRTLTLPVNACTLKGGRSQYGPKCTVTSSPSSLGGRRLR